MRFLIDGFRWLELPKRPVACSFSNLESCPLASLVVLEGFAKKSCNLNFGVF